MIDKRAAILEAVDSEASTYAAMRAAIPEIADQATGALTLTAAQTDAVRRHLQAVARCQTLTRGAQDDSAGDGSAGDRSG